MILNDGTDLIINTDVVGSGSLIVGNKADNYTQFAANGDLTFAGSAGFYPVRRNQAAQPASGVGATQIDVGELLIWRDTDDGNVYLVYNDTTSGIVDVQLT